MTETKRGWIEGKIKTVGALHSKMQRGEGARGKKYKKKKEIISKIKKRNCLERDVNDTLGEMDLLWEENYNQALEQGGAWRGRLLVKNARQIFLGRLEEITRNCLNLEKERN